MSTKIKKSFMSLTCLIISYSYGQVSSIFLNKSDYLSYVDKEYSLDKSVIYYISDSTRTRDIVFPSFTYFVNHEKILNIDEVAQLLNMNCPPKKLFKQFTKISLSLLFENNGVNHGLIFKNLLSNDYLKLDEDIIVIFLFSYRLKKTGTRYLKQINMIEELGFKTLILSMDMPFIESVSDYSKLNQLHFKTK